MLMYAAGKARVEIGYAQDKRALSREAPFVPDFQVAKCVRKDRKEAKMTKNAIQKKCFLTADSGEGKASAANNMDG
jgi:hypothetical protein